MMTNYMLNRPGLTVFHHESPKDWAEARRLFVGGSDVAAILNGSPWATPFTVWCEKLGVSAKKDTAAMKYGRDKESELLLKLQEELENEYELCLSPYTYVNGIFGANLDSIGIDLKTKEETGIEIKTTSELNMWAEVPAQYFLQVQHYMAVCGLNKFIVFVEGRGWFGRYIVYSDQSVQDFIKKEVLDFWQFVEKKEPPYMPRFNNRRELPYIAAAAKAGLLKKSMQDFELIDLCKEYFAAKKELEQAELAFDAIKTSLLLGLGEENEKTVNFFSIKAKEIEIERFNSAAFKEEYPDLYAQFLKKTSYTQLCVKEV